MAVARVQLPDGRIVRLEVPEGTTPEQVTQFVEQNLLREPPAQQAPPSPPAPEPTLAARAIRGGNALGQGLTDSLAETVGAVPDTVAAGLRAVGLNELAPQDPNFYADTLKSGARKIEELLSRPFRGIQPDTRGAPTKTEQTLRSVGGGIGDAASVFVPAAALSRATRAGSTAGNVARSLAAQPGVQAIAGGVAGGVTERTDSPALGLASALATGGALSAGKQLTATGATRRAFNRAAPSGAQLKARSEALFTRAGQAGTVLSEPAGNALLTALYRTGTDEGIDRILHRSAFRVLRLAPERLGTHPDLKDLTLLRRQLGAITKSTEPDERRIARELSGRLDEFLDNLKPKDVIAGDAQTALANLKQARQLWQRFKKSELVAEAIEKAQTQASGVENGLRIQFRQLLNNKRKMRGFTAEEKEAIRDVVEGNFTRNTLRRLGKLGFGSGAQTNVLGGTLGFGVGSGLGHAMGGPGIAIGASVPVLGHLAQKGAERATGRAADYARALAASGRPGVARPDRRKELDALASILLGQH